MHACPKQVGIFIIFHRSYTYHFDARDSCQVSLCGYRHLRGHETPAEHVNSGLKRRDLITLAGTAVSHLRRPVLRWRVTGGRRPIPGDAFGEQKRSTAVVHSSAPRWQHKVRQAIVDRNIGENNKYCNDSVAVERSASLDVATYVHQLLSLFIRL